MATTTTTTDTAITTVTVSPVGRPWEYVTVPVRGGDVYAAARTAIRRMYGRKATIVGSNEAGHAIVGNFIDHGRITNVLGAVHVDLEDGSGHVTTLRQWERRRQ